MKNEENIFEKIQDILYTIVIIVGFFANIYVLPKIVFLTLDIQEEPNIVAYIIFMIIEFYIVAHYGIKKQKKQELFEKELTDKKIEVQILQEKLKKYEN